MAIKCLLIETADKRRFFTLVKNKESLSEYCKTFGSKMMVVKAEIERKQIMDLSKLVSVLCDKNQKTSEEKFRILRKA